MAQKEGCAEGDCGACTVVVGELENACLEVGGRESARIRYRAINSCIRFLPTLDGKELVTVESLADGEQLHPVQQAMVDQHGSQCGFCTPGFVMSLFALYQDEAFTDRCLTLARRRARSARGQSLPLHGLPADHRRGLRDGRLRRAGALVARRRAVARIMLRHCARQRRETALRLPGFFAPRTIDELAAALEREPTSLLLAGGTDVGLCSTKHLRDLPPIVYLGEVAELHDASKEARRMRCG